MLFRELVDDRAQFRELGMTAGDIFHGALSWSFAEDDEPLKMPAPELGCGHDACPDHVVRSGSRRGGAVSGTTATTPQWQCS